MSWFAYSRIQHTTQPSTFDAAAYTGALGRVEMAVACDGTLAIQGRSTGGRQVRVSITNGVAVAPAGGFSIQMVQIRMMDSSGKPWEATCYRPSGDSGKLNLPADGAATLALGPPFDARIKTRGKSDGTRTFSLSITGSGKNKFRIMHIGRGRQAPGFEVINTDGDVIWSGKFSYG